MSESHLDIWSALEREARQSDASKARVLRLLEVGGERGIRLGIKVPELLKEMFIELEERPNQSQRYPQWSGVNFGVGEFRVPTRGKVLHFGLTLTDAQFEPVFLSVCQDLISELLTSKDASSEMLWRTLSRWDRFFKKFGLKGLSRERQQGLYAELHFLSQHAATRLGHQEAVESWRGPHRDFHDFEYGSDIVEIKSTSGKEPRKVRIANERQLDERGLDSLHLFVLTLRTVDHGGNTLVQKIEHFRAELSKDPEALAMFNAKLRTAGYLDAHAYLYTTGYAVIKTEIFEVINQFPRLIELPKGIGDLKYSVMLATLSDYERSVDERLDSIVGHRHE